METSENFSPHSRYCIKNSISLTVTTKLSAKRLKFFHLRSRTRKECQLSPVLFSNKLEGLLKKLRQQKKKKKKNTHRKKMLTISGHKGNENQIHTKIPPQPC
jgi:hypothetical protein